MARDLDGKRMLVTGAASGIGRAVAELAADRGAELLLIDVDAVALDALARAVGGGAHPMDVGDEAAWQRLAAGDDAWDFVVLNAGIMSAPPDADPSASDLRTLDVARYRRVLAVNIDGVVFGLRAALPRMTRRGGAVVVTASAAGLVPFPPDPAYTLTKHAVVGLVRSLAGVLAADHRAGRSAEVRLNAICPGGVQTAMVPAAHRAAARMPPAIIAAEILDLCLRGENGEIRVRLSAELPAETIPPTRIRGWGGSR